MSSPSSLSRRLLAAGLSLTLASPVAIAAPGDPDSTFGVGGLVLHTPGSQTFNISNRPDTVIALNDGKLLVAGHSENGQEVNGLADTDILLARYLPDGQLDTSFGHQGIVTTATSTALSRVSGLLEQADGKLLVYGVHSDVSAYDKGMLVRYLPDGQLDTTFADNGVLTLPLGSTGDQINAAIQQADGNIVIAGSSNNGAGTDFALARIHSDGTLDTSFGNNGIVITDAGNGDVAQALVEQNGKLVAVGTGGSGIIIIRYHSDGSLDTTLDGDGIVDLDVGSGLDAAYSALALSNGKLLVGAVTNNSTSTLLRFNDDGSLDQSYALFGIHTLTSQSGVIALRALANGKIMALSRDSRGAQLNADGTVDTSYATNGETTTLSYMAEARDIIELPDGRHVILGRSAAGDIVLARRLTSSALDDSFDGDSGSADGIVISQPRHISNQTSIQALLTQDDGKTIAIGYANNGDRDITLARYLPDGQLDQSFATDGVAFLSGSGTSDNAVHAIWQGDKILLAGKLGSYAIVARFNNDGSLDTSFGANGYRQITGGTSTTLYQLQLLDDGRIFAVGEKRQDADNDFLAVMLSADGVLDSGFGSNGINSYPLLGQEYAKGALAVNGQFLLFGQTRSSFSSSYSFRVLRINGNGAVDSTFGNNGSLSHAISNPIIGQVITDSSGRALISGTSSSDMFVMRLNADGSKDASFGSQGIASFDVNGYGSGSNALTEQQNGKIVLAGFSMPGSTLDFALLRLNANGVKDTTFADNGTLELDLFGQERFFAITEQSDGTLIAGGFANNFGQFALLRVEGLLDSDDDGTPDINDAFPTDPTETTDTDNDGSGDNSDAFPDNNAAFIDNDGDGQPDSWNPDCDVSCQENSGLTLDPSINDFDNDGLVDSEDNDNGSDNYPPTVTAPPAISIDATGATTEVFLESNGSASASDLVDGTLTPSPAGGNTTVELAPGRYQILWQATDSNNNIGSDTQQVDIVPLAGFEPESQMSGEGNTVSVTVTLNGNAPEYPVVIPLAIADLSTAGNPEDHDATAVAIVIEEDAEPANQGTITFTTIDDGAGEYDETVILDLLEDNGSDTLENAVIDDSLSRHTVTITELNVAPTLTSLTVSQDEESIEMPAGTPTIYDRFREGGIVTLTANMTDPNPQDSHTFEWIINEVVQPETGPTLIIDPELYANGEYLLSVTATDNGNPPLSSEPLQAGVKLLNTPPPFDGGNGSSSGGGGSLSQWLPLLIAALGWRRKTRQG